MMVLNMSSFANADPAEMESIIVEALDISPEYAAKVRASLQGKYDALVEEVGEATDWVQVTVQGNGHVRVELHGGPGGLV